MSDAIYWSACRIAREIRAGNLSSRDIVDACLERIEQVNPKINAVVQLAGERARNEADELDRQAEIAGELPGMVDQVPVDFDTDCVEFEHRCQACDHSETTAPFAEHSARREVPFRHRPQRPIDRHEITRHKTAGLVRAPAIESLDTSICLVEEIHHIRWQRVVGDRQFDIDKRHASILADSVDPGPAS